MSTSPVNSAAAAGQAPSSHNHYQHLGSTLYPETRKRIAELHVKRAQLEFANSPGWVVGAESRAAAATAATTAAVSSSQANN